MKIDEILKKDFKDITPEEWKQLEIEAEEIDREIELHREELDEQMKKLPPDFFDKMHDELMEKIRAIEEDKKIERFLNACFKE